MRRSRRGRWHIGNGDGGAVAGCGGVGLGARAMGWVAVCTATPSGFKLMVLVENDYHSLILLHEFLDESINQAKAGIWTVTSQLKKSIQFKKSVVDV